MRLDNMLSHQPSKDDIVKNLCWEGASVVEGREQISSAHVSGCNYTYSSGNLGFWAAMRWSIMPHRLPFFKHPAAMMQSLAAAFLFQTQLQIPY